MLKLFIIVSLGCLLAGCSLGKVDWYTAEEWRDEYNQLSYQKWQVDSELEDTQSELEDVQSELEDVQSELDDLSSCVEDHPLSASDYCI